MLAVRYTIARRIRYVKFGHCSRKKYRNVSKMRKRVLNEVITSVVQRIIAQFNLW